MTSGICAFKPCRKVAGGIFIDGEGNEKEVCPDHFLECLEAEVRLEKYVRQKKKRLEELKKERELESTPKVGS